MYTLMYLSVATHPMQPYELSSILEQSRLSNKRKAITGCLAYIEGLLRAEEPHCIFVQVLEGQEDAVTAVFDKIKIDSRHTDVKLVRQGYIEKRNFESWEMGFEEIRLPADSSLQGFFRLNPDILAMDGTINDNMLLNFMKSFYKAL
jgi:hypothetical protein